MPETINFKGRKVYLVSECSVHDTLTLLLCVCGRTVHHGKNFEGGIGGGLFTSRQSGTREGDRERERERDREREREK
jgi:hypothetical protein